ncbi:MAG TPA: histidine kinase [Rhodospirillaceae bacterium]|nr:histidine kinase [Rhodospirillaceae bacterium]
MRRVSPLTLRILAVNVMALAILVGSLLYLGHYQDSLIESEINALQMQARLSANAIAEGAVVLDQDERNILSPLLARLMIRRLVEASETRTRLFDMDDILLADSQILLNIVGRRPVRPLEQSSGFWLLDSAMDLFNIIDGLAEKQEYARYPEEEIREGNTYDIIQKAKNGELSSQIWSLPEGGLLLSVAVPIQRYRQILGTLILTKPDTHIAQAIYDVRMSILKIFGATLLITILLSFYLAHTISRPLKQLSKAAEKVRIGQAETIGLNGSEQFLNSQTIPDFSARHDEIGDLSLALRDMTSALARRLGAIENFAADVAHEIKNPLTSLRSAVETAAIVKDPARHEKLMQVIRDDVDRLDRLISDISKASRLDAELTRDEASTLNVFKLLETLVDFYNDSKEQCATIQLDPESEKNIKITGVEGRLVQVLQNLIDNASSFSPPESVVNVAAHRGADGFVELIVEDCGGGIPDNKLEAIFERFYTERPKKEKFGTHSGLGLSISKQIVEAHQGRIWAENRRDKAGHIIGARFIVHLPLLI